MALDVGEGKCVIFANKVARTTVMVGGGVEICESIAIGALMVFDISAPKNNSCLT